jgi:hypothetical protein
MASRWTGLEEQRNGTAGMDRPRIAWERYGKERIGLAGEARLGQEGTSNGRLRQGVQADRIGVAGPEGIGATRIDQD